MTNYITSNPPQSEMTAEPSKYPQKYFKDKPCKVCKTIFSPQAPSHMTCSQECADLSASNSYLNRNYGIDMTDYKRMLDEQDSKCAVCGSEGFTMAKHHKMKLVVDHCHTTGKVRGLLCHNCNRALGLLQDSTDNLDRAKEYLQK